MTAFNTDGFDVSGKNVWIHDCQIWNQVLKINNIDQQLMIIMVMIRTTAYKWGTIINNYQHNPQLSRVMMMLTTMMMMVKMMMMMMMMMMIMMIRTTAYQWGTILSTCSLRGSMLAASDWSVLCHHHHCRHQHHIHHINHTHHIHHNHALREDQCQRHRTGQ